MIGEGEHRFPSRLRATTMPKNSIQTASCLRHLSLFFPHRMNVPLLYLFAKKKKEGEAQMDGVMNN
jgi:hypothetical protein